MAGYPANWQTLPYCLPVFKKCFVGKCFFFDKMLCLKLSLHLVSFCYFKFYQPYLNGGVKNSAGKTGIRLLVLPGIRQSQYPVHPY
jgi:hypothetical protein